MWRPSSKASRARTWGGWSAIIPDLMQKPVDAAYGPYPDQFNEDQHRFGPFQPIKDAVRRLRILATDAPADPGKPTDSNRN